MALRRRCTCQRKLFIRGMGKWAISRCDCVWNSGRAAGSYCGEWLGTLASERVAAYRNERARPTVDQNDEFGYRAVETRCARNRAANPVTPIRMQGITGVSIRLHPGCTQAQQGSPNIASFNGKRMHSRSVVAKYGSWAYDFLREHVDPNAQIVDELLKHKYAFGLNRRTRKQLAAMALPYPKGNHADTP